MSATLEELLATLTTIADLVRQGRDSFDADPRQRWSIERLWIFAGNLAERYCREAEIDEGMEPWAELIASRNVYAHYTPRAINYDRVWADAVTDVGRLADLVTEAVRR